MHAHNNSFLTPQVKKIKTPITTQRKAITPQKRAQKSFLENQEHGYLHFSSGTCQFEASKSYFVLTPLLEVDRKALEKVTKILEWLVPFA